jgi:PPOX class probable F420-dependent enzyme
MIPRAGRALGHRSRSAITSHGAAAVSDPLAEPRPAERLATEAIAWLTTAGADGQPQSSSVWFHWDGSAFWLRTQVAARKVTNIRANPKAALHLADDGNGGAT